MTSRHIFRVGVNPTYQDEYFRVGPCLHGFGLFVTRALKKGFEFGPYLGRIISEQEADHEDDLKNAYLFKCKNGVNIDGRPEHSATPLRYANVGETRDKQNCCFFEEDGQVWARLIKPVKSGDQVYVHYGKSNSVLLSINCHVQPLDSSVIYQEMNGPSREAFQYMVRYCRQLESENIHIRAQLIEKETQSVCLFDRNSAVTDRLPSVKKRKADLLALATTAEKESRVKEEDTKVNDTGVRKTTSGYTARHKSGILHRWTSSSLPMEEKLRRAELFYSTGQYIAGDVPLMTPSGQYMSSETQISSVETKRHDSEKIECDLKPI